MSLVVIVATVANLLPASAQAQITFLNTWGSPGNPGDGINQFNQPLSVAVGPTGMVYVADTGNQRVQVFDSGGVYQSTIGTTGSAGSR